MRRKMSYHRLNSMWKQSSSNVKINGASLKAYHKKSMDDLCFQAELAETNWHYAWAICDGMRRLLKMGVDVNVIISHNRLMQKLINLGRDLMQTSNKGHDIFFLGVFVELKIYSMWQKLEFYQILINALKQIKKNISFLSDSMKQRLILSLKKFNQDVFDQFVAINDSA